MEKAEEPQPLSDAPIQYFNRYSHRVEVEAVYGESFLRWTYGQPLGRLVLQLLIKRYLFSRWYGWRMQSPGSRSKIGPFICRYNVDPSEFAESVEAYSSFNDFFIRRLKPAARPVDPDKLTVVFPADGRHLGFQNLSEATGVFLKGQEFDIDLLLMDAELANRYRNGTLILSRLCPVDYHRFHFPVGGVPAAAKLVNGFLFSVNPIALRRNLGYLWSNKRVVTSLESDRFGRVLLIEIGATCVGGIRQSYEPGRAVLKGQEKGWFEFGGSSTITLFERGRVVLADDLIENTRRNRELYARMGDRMASRA